jgi:hypothetical protein
MTVFTLLATNSKNKNIRDLYREINEFKRDYQPRNNLMKDENDELLADSQNILNTWKNYFSQLLNVHNVSDDVTVLEVEIAIAKLKKYKSPSSDQILAELIHKLINSVSNKEELPDQWKESIIVPVLKKGDETDCSNCRGISLINIIQNVMEYPSLRVKSIYR